ncbi:hypothetical protein J27TS7_26190 [Paenibacillus dendritiformis]|nr:hypothetical protein J27TS7_26190 [Paenibacillus dendritiformis]
MLKMKKILFELADEVTDEKSFLHFMSELRKDRVNHREEWENESIEAFLEAASEWGLASNDGLPYYNKPHNPWKRCAQILYMGKIYE